MGVVLVLLCAIASAGCQLLFNLDHIDRTDAAQPIGDGSPDLAPGSARRVFATSGRSNGAMGGLAGADAICQARASAGGLPGTFMAWLSTGSASPASRMTHGDGPYRLPNDAVVANDWGDLTDGTLRTPINVDESGNGVPGEYICMNAQLWSNTDAQGNRSGNNSCNDWTSASASGAASTVTATDPTWTEPTCWPVQCSVGLAIYCFQQ